MRNFSLATIFVMSIFVPPTSFADETNPPTCGQYDFTDLTEAKPVVRVEPEFGEKLRNDSVSSCIVVIYGLREKGGTNGQALLAHKPKAVAWSDGVSRSARKAAQRALAKWLFLAKTQPASDEAIYFHVFTF